MGVPMDIGAQSAPTGATAASPISQAGGDIISGLTGGAMSHVMGMIFGGAEDQRQINQQTKLQNLQIQGAEQMSDIQLRQQEQLWNDTNYSAQVAQAEKAGLNPAMLYSKGGAGGQIGGGLPMPSEGQAANSAQTTGANVGMAMMLSEMKLNNAQANLAQAQAEKTAGVDTTKTVTETSSIAQGIQNQQAAETLTKLQSDAQDIQNQIQGKTIAEQQNIIMLANQQAVSQARSAMATANVDEATQTTKINLLKQTYINSTIQAQAMQSGIALNNEEIQGISARIIQGYQQLNINRAQQQTNENNAEAKQHLEDQISTQITNEIAGQKGWGQAELSDMIKTIGGILKQ